MRTQGTLWLVFLAVLLAGCVQAAPAAGSVTGNWQGTLKVGPAATLRVVFKVAKQKNGALAAKLDSPDQGAKDIPVDAVTFKDGTLRLQVTSIAGSYEGKLSRDGKTITGTWTQGSGSLPLVLERVTKVAEVKRPQEPKKPYPYDEEEVVYQNKAAGIPLAGTLTRPRGGGPFPAALLITGSGPQNRDEELLGHKPFLVLADYLTRRGVAMLRVDDRGVGGSGGDIRTATTEDFAGDVLAGVEYLKGRKEIDGGKIGLIGHSEGGVIAPLVAARSKDVDFIVLMAGTGLTGEEILYRQAALISRAMGVPEQAIAQNRAAQERAFAVLKAEKDDDAAAKKLREIFGKVPAGGKPAPKTPLEPNVLAEGQIKTALTPWFRFFLTYDPRPALRQVQCPVLAIIGENDLQVPAKENLRAIEEALKAGGNRDYTVKELPGLNHLFQTSKTGSPAEYAAIEETIAPAALRIIGDWIEQRVER